LMVGSTILLNQRVPTMTRVNLNNPGISTRFLPQFPNEEATVIKLTNQTPPRIVMGLRGTNGGNQVRVVRMIRVPQPPEFNLDTTFSGDGSQALTVPAPNPFSFLSLDLTDLELTAANNIVLSGTGFRPNILMPGAPIPTGFVCTVNSIFAFNNCNSNLPLERINAIAINGNNQIVVVGQRDSDLAVARLSSALVLDTTFNPNIGFNSTCFQRQFQPLQPPRCLESKAVDVALDTQGRIVVAGDTSMPLNPLGPSRALAIARFNTNGSLDTTFGIGGQRTIGEGVDTHTQTSSLALFNLNRFVVGGTVTQIGIPNGNSTLSIQRFIDP
jgi:uncharacterized delta-60 repeat protein